MVKILYLYLKYISRNRKNSEPAYWGPWKKAICLQATEKCCRRLNFGKRTFGKKSRDAEVSKAEKNFVKYFFLYIWERFQIRPTYWGPHTVSQTHMDALSRSADKNATFLLDCLLVKHNLAKHHLVISPSF